MSEEFYKEVKLGIVVDEASYDILHHAIEISVQDDSGNWVTKYVIITHRGKKLSFISLKSMLKWIMSLENIKFIGIDPDTSLLKEMIPEEYLGYALRDDKLTRDNKDRYKRTRAWKLRYGDIWGEIRLSPSNELLFTVSIRNEDNGHFYIHTSKTMIGHFKGLKKFSQWLSKIPNTTLFKLQKDGSMKDIIDVE